MATCRGTENIRRFDTRGVALAGTPPASAQPPVRSHEGHDAAELPLGAWRRRARPQANVITLRIPSWASSSSKP
jgi:hypothetical protein